MNKKILGIYLAIGLLAIVSSSTFAQETPTKASAENSTKIMVQSRYISESDVDQQAGSLSVSESQFLIEHNFKLKNGMPVMISFEDDHTDINSDVAVFLPSQLEARILGLGVKFPAPFTKSDNYFIGVDVFPSMYTDGWNESSNSAFRMPFRGYLIYRRDDNFIVFGGLKIRPNYDSVVLPVLGFIYKPNDRLAFNISSYNPNITYKLSDKTTALLEADLVNEEYEVTRNGETGRILIYRELSLGTGLEHNFTDSIKGLVSVGAVFARQIKYEDDNGKIAPDAGMYVKARVTVNF